MKTFILTIIVALMIGSQAFSAQRVLTYRNHNTLSAIEATTAKVVSASLPAAVSSVDAVSTATNQDTALSVGILGAEGSVLIIPAGSSKIYPLSIPKGARVSLKGIDGAVHSGTIILNFFGDGRI